MGLGRILTWAGKMDQAESSFLRVLEVSPGYTSAYCLLSVTLLMQGKLEEALAAILREKAPGYRHYGCTMVYHALGKRAESDAAFAELLKEGEQWAAQLCMAQAFRGQIDDAFHWLDRSHAHRDSGLVVILAHPIVKPLHSDPRWPEFLKKIGLAKQGRR